MEKKYSNKYLIETAIGLQDVDHLENSKYFLSESQRYIKGEISLDELEEIVPFEPEEDNSINFGNKLTPAYTCKRK